MLESLLIIMLQATQLREYNTGVFSSKYCQISKNTYFEEHMRMAAFENKLPRVWLTFVGNYLSKLWFIRLLLNVQQFQTKLKRGCFFVNFHKRYITV